MKILIVEDDKVIADRIKNHLEKWGYDAKVAMDFRRIHHLFIEYDPQLVLMDVTLPFYSGYYWCEEIRKLSSTPIIFVSSAIDDLNIVRAIDNGADDYITKPFNYEVLMAKIQAILRRTYDFGENVHLLEHPQLFFNMDTFTIRAGDQTINLTKNEAIIFQKLMEHKGKIVKRELLMRSLWDSESFVEESALYTNINRLRKKLQTLELDDFITTIKGEGYMIEV
ncbi:response regulator transcription factor [Facklamia lactis]|uniref:response regulator transcription factor n=1 Tax=Facklamia lactis TaxID=2749967 RepID=UPI0018CE68C4|nr:response regulator transcription factor [Facklamia lactis]MBG9979538.1 response regulator transcription factor [Facklamia lactis]